MLSHPYQTSDTCHFSLLSLYPSDNVFLMVSMEMCAVCVIFLHDSDDGHYRQQRRLYEVIKQQFRVSHAKQGWTGLPQSLTHWS